MPAETKDYNQAVQLSIILNNLSATRERAMKQNNFEDYLESIEDAEKVILMRLRNSITV